MHNRNTAQAENRSLHWVKYALGLVWLAIILACLLHKDQFTLEGILTYTPRQPLLAVLVLLALFALKSLSIFLYSGLLYVASGILFPLPAAIAVNIAGTAVMVSIPYWLGKRLGNRTVQYILERYPKVAFLHDLRSNNDFFLCSDRAAAGHSACRCSQCLYGRGRCKIPKLSARLSAWLSDYLHSVSHYGHEHFQYAFPAVSHRRRNRISRYAGILYRILFFSEKAIRLFFRETKPFRRKWRTE